jgi:hypothetical protein
MIESLCSLPFSSGRQHISTVEIDAELLAFSLIVLIGTVKTGFTKDLFLELIQQPLSALLNWYCQGKLAKLKRHVEWYGCGNFWL